MALKGMAFNGKKRSVQELSIIAGRHDNGETMKEIADSLGLGRERVRQLIFKFRHEQKKVWKEFRDRLDWRSLSPEPWESLGIAEVFRWAVR